MPPIRSRSSSQAPADHTLQLSHAGEQRTYQFGTARRVETSKIRGRESSKHLSKQWQDDSARAHVRGKTERGSTREDGRGAACLRLPCAACLAVSPHAIAGAADAEAKSRLVISDVVK
eukprot:6199525-Pleurochrysis_carterae.AAC.14